MANKGGFIGQDGLNAPDSPTGVSGSAGQGQVEVSFTSPSDVGGSAITGYNVQSNNGDGTWQSSYDIANASYDNKSFSVNAQEGSPHGLYFKSDGTKVYVVGDQGDSVDQFSLSTAWDISTASFDNVTFSLASQVTSPKGIFFKPDGSSFYVQGQTVADRYVYQYNMTTAWDISTASYASKSFSITSDNEPLGLFFKSDGTKAFITGQQNNSVYQYGLSTAWDASTGSYDSVSFDFSATASFVNGLAFSNDGTKLFLAGYDNAASETTIFSYTLSTAWDLTTASYETSFSVNSQEPDTFDVQFSTDGTKMYIVGLTNDTIYQYTTGQLDYPTASPVTITGLTNGTSYTFNVWAINAFGWSAPSDASASVSPIASLAVSIAGDTSNVMDYVQIQTTGNATDWGDWGSTASGTACGGSTTRGLGADSNVEIDYITFASQGNAVGFGNLSVSRRFMGCASNSTRCVWAGGNSTGFNNQIDYVNPATTGNAVDFGDLSGGARNGLTSMICNSVYGLFGGGQVSGTEVATVDVVTIATTGNSSSYGNLSQSLAYGAGAASSTRGLHAGGTSGGGTVGVVNIYYTTISSSGSWTSFGNLTQGRTSFAGTSDTTRAVFMGGERSSPTRVNTIDYVTIASAGNATDFGDLTVAKRRGGVCGNAHGGLQ